jgi:hypothetical protein
MSKLLFSEPCYWANNSSQDDITLCCDIMGALKTFHLYNGAILIGPSTIFGEHGACPQQNHLCDKIETNALP